VNAGASLKVLRYGTCEQKQKYLPKCISGECILAVAMTEPGAGSDLQGLTTKATKVEGGWLLNGAKTFITNGASADLVVVVARTSMDKPAVRDRVYDFWTRSDGHLDTERWTPKRVSRVKTQKGTRERASFDRPHEGTRERASFDRTHRGTREF